MPSLLTKVGIFILGAFTSRIVQDYGYWGYSDDWLVGPIFGIVVLVWKVTSIREILSVRNIGFLLLATLIYLLVLWVPEIVEKSTGQELEMEGSVIGLVLGTTLLPLVHALCLRVSWGRAIAAILGIFIIFSLLVMPVMSLDQFGPAVSSLVNPVSFWQGLYLAFMFARPPLKQK